MLSGNVYASKWWSITDYIEDIGEHLKEREKRRYIFYYLSPEAQYRNSLIHWMKEYATKKNLDRSCLHLAVYLLDIFMDNHRILMERLHLVALVCLLLATKIDERDSKVPKLTELKQLVQDQYPVSDFKALEILILKFFNWNIAFPTTSHFVDFYCLSVITQDDFTANSHRFNNKIDLIKTSLDIVNSYLDIILMDIGISQAKPSLIAAAAMAATRSTLGLQPIWTEKLEQLTKYTLGDITYRMEELLHELKHKEPYHFVNVRPVKNVNCRSVVEVKGAKRRKM